MARNVARDTKGPIRRFAEDAPRAMRRSLTQDQSDAATDGDEPCGVQVALVDGTCQVTVHPTYTSDAALIRLMEWFDKCTAWPVTLIVHCALQQKWCSQSVANKDAAFSQTAEFMLAAYEVKHQPVLETGDLFGSIDAQHPYAQLLALWSEVGIKDGPAFMRRATTSLLEEKFWLLRFDRQNQLLAFDEIGAAMHGCPHIEFRNMQGRPLEDLPAYWFGRSCARSYLSVCNSNKPILQAVDAVLGSPAHPDVRHRFLRVAVPLQAHGQSFLLSGMMKENNLDFWRSVEPALVPSHQRLMECQHPRK